MAQLCPLFDLTAWAEPATVLAVTTGENATLAPFGLVFMGLASHFGGGPEK